MANKIHLIPEEIIRQIAAGEVITRPADAVKELVENSIDAHASKIAVILENGGIDRMIVEDNGEGIQPGELKLAFELHTSSKITQDNIHNVSTLGFRGEALSSIGSVSRVKIRSKVESEEFGSELIMENLRIISQNQVRMSKGTRIEISGLFHNYPARRKFLKSVATEKRHILTVMTHFCLTYPDIHFTVGERKGNTVSSVLESPTRKELLAVLFDVFGPEITSGLVPIRGNVGYWKITGYISKPILVRKDRKFQYLSINGRLIRNTELVTQIERAYGSQLLKSNYPVIILSLKGDYNLVDYNIHPQKLEVRFREDDPIFHEISTLVQETLVEKSEIQQLPHKKAPNVSNAEIDLQEGYEPLISTKEVIPGESFVQTSLEEITPQNNSVNHTRAVFVQGGFRVLGHIFNKFALIEKDSELWLMDVHASDERVKFERYQEHRESLVMSQTFLKPVSVSINSGELDLLVELQDTFQKFGFQYSIQHLTSTILIHGVPVYYDQRLDKDSLHKLINDFLTADTNIEISSKFNAIEYRVVSRLACHGAVRSGYPVSERKVAEILSNLLKCNSPWTCAHGRPTIIRISHSKLESWFKRQGQ